MADEKGQEVFGKVASIGSKESDSVGGYKKSAVVTGASVGGVFGLYYGFAKKKNILMMGVFGAIVGAVITKIFIPK